MYSYRFILFFQNSTLYKGEQLASLHPRNEPQYPPNRGLDEPSIRPEYMSEFRNFRPLSNIEPWSSDFTLCSLTIISMTRSYWETSIRALKPDKEIHKKASLFVKPDFAWRMRHACSEDGSLSTELTFSIQ